MEERDSLETGGSGAFELGASDVSAADGVSGVDEVSPDDEGEEETSELSSLEGGRLESGAGVFSKLVQPTMGTIRQTASKSAADFAFHVFRAAGLADERVSIFLQCIIISFVPPKPANPVDCRRKTLAIVLL